MRSIFYSALFVVTSLFSTAQDWVEMMQRPDGNFYDVQASFNQYWQGKDITEKGKGYKAFKRWENFVERRVGPSGDLSQLSLTAKNFKEFLDDYNGGNTTTYGGKFSGPSQIMSTTWAPIGPMGPISGNAGGQLLKSGRLCFVSISPTNTNVLFIGAPAGGLWKSTNGGTSWTTNTDNFLTCGFADLAFDPTNTNIMYTATGDGDAGDTKTDGVYKSIDGGTTWTATGLTFNISAGVTIRRLIVNPTNPQIVMAAASNGIWRTTNGGTNWTQLLAGTSIFDMEFQPGNANTVYAAGTTFRRSTDGGATWTTISSGIPTTGCNRMAIAVTPADVNYVYVLASNSANNGMLGFYKSNSAAVSFTQMPTTLNLLGYNSNGADTGGQGWYDLCIACSPLNKDEVVTGGVNVWRTTNGGTSWTIYGHWTGSVAPFTHADQHDLEYAPDGTLFNTNDGTVYKRTATSTSWAEISGTINISQIYKIGLSNLTANKWITGHQDNGTSTWNGTTYQARLGGDGMDCFIDRTNDNNLFGEYYNGTFNKSTDGGVTWNACTTGMSGAAPWVTIWKQDPVTATRLYAGRQNMFVSNNSAGSWAQIGTLPVAGNVVEFAIAPSNNQVLYVVKSNAIMKTSDGGTTWSNITGTISTALSFVNVAVSPTDASKVWVVCSNFSAGNKVFYSANGGTTWTNYSANLPNIPGDCLLYEPGTSDRIYVGMDRGVYYRDNTQSTWTLYNAGLPNIPVSDMEMSAAMPGKIVAATYGRGTWMVDVVPAAVPPVSSFIMTGTVCTNVAKTFNDNSTNSPSSWSWSVTPSVGVTIASATSQNPNITFANTGNYVVAMTASNTNGPGNTYTQAVTVYATPVISIASNTTTICSGGSVTFTASGASTYAWACPPATSVCVYTPAASTNYSFVGTSAQGCSATGTKSITVVNVAVNTSATNNQVCPTQSVILTATGATSYTWNPGSIVSSTISVSPSVMTTYTATGKTGNCTGTSLITINVAANPTVTATSTESVMCIGATASITASGASSYSWSTGSTNATILVFPSTTTSYTVTGFNGVCYSSFVYVQNVASCTGVDQLSTNNGSYKVYPNPFSDEINITSKEEVDVTVYNSIGQLVKQIKFKDKTVIHTSELPKGVYMLFVKGQSGTQSYKVVKN